MNSNSPKKIFLVFYLVLVGLMAIDARADNHTFEWETTASDPLSMTVETGSGSIRVQAGSGDLVTIKGEIRVNRRWFGAVGAG